jgi:hypothetical protein
MHRVAAKFVPRILTADQKQQHVNVCVELLQITSDATFLPRVTRAGFTVMIISQSNSPPNEKVQTH